MGTNEGANGRTPRTQCGSNFIKPRQPDATTLTEQRISDTEKRTFGWKIRIIAENGIRNEFGKCSLVFAPMVGKTAERIV